MWSFYHSEADEGFIILDHISNLQRLQEPLHLMNHVVSNQHFFMVSIMSLPKSWDNFTSLFLAANGKDKPMVKSHELIAILMDEDCCQS